MATATLARLGSALGFNSDWLFLTPSEHMCQECYRRDCQQSIEECADSGCSKLAHRLSRTQIQLPVNWNADGGEVLLCKTCISEGNAPSCESESSQSSGEPNGGEQPEDNSQAWGKEDMLWIGSLISSFAKEPNKEARRTAAKAKWNSVKQHVGQELHEIVEEMIDKAVEDTICQ